MNSWKFLCEACKGCGKSTSNKQSKAQKVYQYWSDQFCGKSLLLIIHSSSCVCIWGTASFTPLLSAQGNAQGLGACEVVMVQIIYSLQKLQYVCSQALGSIRCPVKAAQWLTLAFNVLVCEYFKVLIFKTYGIRRIVFTYSLMKI